MNKKIRSISISDNIDNQLMDDSKYRGLTISANISRILFDYFQPMYENFLHILLFFYWKFFYKL